MATETTQRLDVGALAGSVMIDARARIAQTISSTVFMLDEYGWPLSEKQAEALLVNLLAAFDGHERYVAELLVNDLREAGVRTWGLPSELADLEDADDAS
jgi:hypothetical protein